MYLSLLEMLYKHSKVSPKFDSKKLLLYLNRQTTVANISNYLTETIYLASTSATRIYVNLDKCYQRIIRLTLNHFKTRERSTI